MPEQIENRMVVDSEWRPLHKPFCRCDMCEMDIYEGNDYYNFDGDIICDDCHEDYVKEHFRRRAG